MSDLSGPEKFLLDWLSKEDSSAYGECYGQALDALINAGLAEVSPEIAGKHPHFRRVKLTEGGWQALRSLSA